MRKPTLLQLECFLALAAEGSFAGAAERVSKSHPAVYATLKSLEDTLGVTLLDRSGYRVTLTPAGKRFHEEAARVVDTHLDLARFALQLRDGVEPDLRIVIGDLCPLTETLAPLSAFFAGEPHTRPIFLSESIAGPWARLANGDAELSIHHIGEPTPELETIPLFSVDVIPVAAPGLLPDGAGKTPSLRRLRALRQCILRDSAIGWQPTAYHLLEGVPAVHVGDQATKREVLLQGLAWGHMPRHMVADDLTQGRLLDLSSPLLPGATLPHFALRRRDACHGPVAERLWQFLSAARGSCI